MESGETYPNIYVFLVGRPAGGKSVAISRVHQLLNDAAVCKLSPNTMTKQGLTDMLVRDDCMGSFITPDGFGDTFHYIAVCISEATNLMAEYNDVLAGFLTDEWDCPTKFEEATRGGGVIGVSFPGLSMVLGVTAKTLGGLVRNQWDSGFMARVILVHCEERVVPKDIWAKHPDNVELEQEIIRQLKQIAELSGAMTWTPTAGSLLQQFTEDPTTDLLHPRLENYNNRRDRHLCKLAMIAALSNLRMTVTEADFQTALEWLHLAEASMGDLFEEMITNEDTAALEQLAYWMMDKEEVRKADVVNKCIELVGVIRYKAFLDGATTADWIDLNPVTGCYNPGQRGREL